MGKVFGIGLMVGILYIALTLYTEGSEQAFGGAFSTFARTNEEEATEILGQTSAYLREDPSDASSRPIPITRAVRERMNEHMETAQKRRQAAADRF